MENTKKVFALAISLIIAFEGLRYTAYLDPPGIPTICYGHTSGVKLGQKSTDKDCIQYRQEDLEHANSVINKYVTVTLTQGQRGALLDFVFNLGEGKFSRSTLLKRLNQGRYADACKSLKGWVCSKVKLGTGDINGKCGKSTREWRQLEGLVRRREAEYKLCMEETDD